MIENRPIWEDFPIVLPDVPSDGQEYTVFADGEPIFTGRAYAFDGTTAEIIINELCADYLRTEYPQWFSHTRFVENYTLPEFRVETPEGFVSRNIIFTPDWSYDTERDWDIAAAPINGVVHAEQMLTYSVYNADQVLVRLFFEDGTMHRIIVPVERKPDFNSDFSADFARSKKKPASGTLCLPLFRWQGLKAVEIEAHEEVERYEVHCKGSHLLTYRNAFGGWDTFLIEAAYNTSDAISRKEYTRKAEPYAINRGRTNYLNEVQQSWNFTTTPLDDRASQRLHHLFGSNEVYLTDLATDVTSAVVITTNANTYQTIRSAGNTLTTYPFTLELAQKRQRR